MKKIVIVTLISFLATITFATDYYVCNSGDDSNTGLSINSPWQTISKINSATFKAGDKILFNKGDLFFGSLIISSSGEAANPIYIGAYGSGASPVITGLTTVENWNDLGSNIWESSNPVSTLSTCNMVVVDGTNTEMGRSPNTGFYAFQSHTTNNKSITSNNLNSSTDWTGAELVIRSNHFITDRRVIESHSSETITWSGSTSNLTDLSGFIIQNDLRTLDQQNEWYFNPTSKKIRIFSISQPTDVKVASVENTITINGNYITVEGINVKGSNSYNILINDSKKYSIIKGCEISFAGIFGINCYGTNAKISNNNIIESQSNGIKATGTSSYVTLYHNKISNSGLLFGMAQSGSYRNGIMSLSRNQTIEFNSIENSGYCGITYYGDSCLITKNFINNFCSVTDDGGGIYTYTGSTRQLLTHGIISDNIILNGIGAPNGMGGTFPNIGVGIYLDELTRNIEISSNSIAHCAHAGIFCNHATMIEINDNTVFDGKHSQLRINSSMKEDFKAVDMSVKNNIMFAKTSEELVCRFYSYIDHLESMGYFNDNYYFRPMNETSTFSVSQPSEYGSEYKTFEEWKSFSGQDANSHKSNQVISNESDMSFFYNRTDTDKLIMLEMPMLDVKGNKYANSVNLQPYTSIILMKDYDQATMLFDNTVIRSSDMTIYPNPFSSLVNFKFSVKEYSNVSIGIYDTSGRKIIQLANQYYSPGIYILSWNGTASSDQLVRNGAYFCNYSLNNNVTFSKIILEH